MVSLLCHFTLNHFYLYRLALDYDDKYLVSLPLCYHHLIVSMLLFICIFILLLLLQIVDFYEPRLAILGLSSSMLLTLSNF